MAITSPLTQALINQLIAMRPGPLGWGTVHQVEDLDQAILLALVNISQQLAGKSGSGAGTVQPLPSPTSAGQSNPGVPEDLLLAEPINVAAMNDFGYFTAKWSGIASVVIALDNGGIIYLHLKNDSGTIDTLGPMDDNNPTGDDYWQGYDFKIQKGLRYAFQSSIAGEGVIYVVGQQTLV